MEPLAANRGLRMHGGRLSLRRKLAMGLALALSASVDGDAQAKPRGAIYFQVIDTAVNPLVGAEIVLPHLGLAMRLAEEGALLLVDVPDGMYLVQARHAGYRADWLLVRVSSDTARAHFMLMPAAHPLGGGQMLGAEPVLGVDPAAALNTSALFDVNQIPLSTLAGVEVYPTLAGVPPEFRVPGAECGVVLVWSAGR